MILFLIEYFIEVFIFWLTGVVLAFVLFVWITALANSERSKKDE